MKKLSILLVLLFSVSTGLFCSAYADDANEDIYHFKNLAVNNTQSKKQQLPKVDAAAAIVIDTKSGRVLYEKNAYTKTAMASTTKIMTAIVAIENGNMDDVVTASKRAAGVGGSQIHLKAGEKLTLRELLYGLMLESGNDAAIAIAEHIGGTVEKFCDMMNKKAIEIGANNTHFTSPHGLDNPEHYTTPYELAKITQYALKNSLFAKIVATHDISIPNRALHNTNELLGAYPGVDGVKTGYTGQAGRCLVTTANRNNLRVISVVIGSPTRNARAQSSTNILNYAFNSYTVKTLIKKGEIIGRLPVLRGIMPEVEIQASQEVKLPLRQDEIDNLQKEIAVSELITAPVYKNVEVGSVKFKIGEKIIAETPVVTKEDVRLKTFKDYLFDIIYEWGRIIRPEKP